MASLLVMGLLSSSAAFLPASVATSPSSAVSKTALGTTSFESSNSVVETSNLPGNFRFDPLQCSQTKSQLVQYRQAEMKHARLAMLAMLAWMWQDYIVVHPLATPFFEGRTFPQFVGALVGLPAALELYGEDIARRHTLDDHEVDENDPSYFIGNLDLDIFHLYPAETESQRQVQFAEIMVGRFCMISAAGRLAHMTLDYFGFGGDDGLLSFLPAVQSTAETVEELVV